MRRAILGLAALAILLLHMAAEPVFSATTTITTVTHTRVTLTTVTTVTTNPSVGERAYLVLVVLVAAAATIAVVGGYLLGRKRARRELLRVSS
jgi:hypothetical protein